MRIVRVADRVLLFDGTGQLIANTSVADVDARLARLRLEREYIGIYPVTVQRPPEEQDYATVTDSWRYELAPRHREQLHTAITHVATYHNSTATDHADAAVLERQQVAAVPSGPRRDKHIFLVHGHTHSNELCRGAGKVVEDENSDSSAAQWVCPMRGCQ
jgi:hypothetical protein